MVKTIEITKDEVINRLKLELISEIHSISISLSLFEKKYSKKFEDFEKMILAAKEKFEEWDDYIEWKAYREAYKDCSKKLKELNGAEDIKIIAR